MANFATLPASAVLISGNQVKTTSLKVAEFFGKRHSHVLEKIESLDCSPAFTSANFSAHAVKIRAGAVLRDSKHYEMTKDGFMFLVMGFTGQKAARIKEAYINAFNEMEAKIKFERDHDLKPRGKVSVSYPRTAKDLPFVKAASAEEQAMYGHRLNWWKFERSQGQQFTETNIERGNHFFLQLMRLASVNVSEAQKAAKHAIMHLGSGLGGNVGLYAEESIFAGYLADAAINWMVQDQKETGKIRLPFSAEVAIEELPHIRK